MEADDPKVEYPSETKVGGGLGLAKQNPGNIMWNQRLADQYGARKADNGLASFPTENIGQQALEEQVVIKKDLSIRQTLYLYAPPCPAAPQACPAAQPGSLYYACDWRNGNAGRHPLKESQPRTGAAAASTAVDAAGIHHEINFRHICWNKSSHHRRFRSSLHGVARISSGNNLLFMLYYERMWLKSQVITRPQRDDTTGSAIIESQ